VEGVAIQVDIRLGHLPAAHGAGPQWLHWKTLLVYLDDVIVISPDF